MSFRTICAHLFGVTAFLAALLVLPQTALAHAGHTHIVHVHTAQASTTDVAHAADVAEERAEQTLSAVAQDGPGPSHDTPCDRGCCAQSSCAACFSLVAPLPPQVAPPSLSTFVAFSATRLPPGIGGPSLRRPPRSFA
jgi:hypothetical protein